MKNIIGLLLTFIMVLSITTVSFAAGNNTMDLIDANPYQRASQAPTIKYDLSDGAINANGTITLKSSYAAKLLKTSTGKLKYNYTHETNMVDADTTNMSVYIFEEGKDPKFFHSSKDGFITNLWDSGYVTRTGFDTGKYYYFFWDRAAKFDIPTEITSTISE